MLGAPFQQEESKNQGFPWYVIRVRPNFDRRAAIALMAKGLDTYAPTYPIVSNWSDRKKTIELPLFAGYVFSRFDLDRRISVLASPGVLGILSFGKVIVQVEDQEIQAIHRFVSLGRGVRPAQFLNVGERVRVKCGPLEGVEGILLQLKGKHRLVISIDILRRAVSAEFDIDQVEAVLPRRSGLQSVKVS